MNEDSLSIQIKTFQSLTLPAMVAPDHDRCFSKNTLKSILRSYSTRFVRPVFFALQHGILIVVFSAQPLPQFVVILSCLVATSSPWCGDFFFT